jgi:hypothetical protein
VSTYTHNDLVKRAAAWLTNRMNCRFVLCEVATGTGEFPDAIAWKYGYQSHMVEVKVSRADFFADRLKSFRREPEKGMGMFRWFMVPAKLITLADLEGCDGWGLLEVQGRSVKITRKAQHFKDYNRSGEICALVQGLANAQLCAPMALNDWFAHPDSAVGRTRKQRREISDRQREADLVRTCDHREPRYEHGEIVGFDQPCGTVIATGYYRCSIHGGRTRGEKRRKSWALPQEEVK